MDTRKSVTKRRTGCEKIKLAIEEKNEQEKNEMRNSKSFPVNV